MKAGRPKLYSKKIAHRLFIPRLIKPSKRNTLASIPTTSRGRFPPQSDGFTQTDNTFSARGMFFFAQITAHTLHDAHTRCAIIMAHKIINPKKNYTEIILHRVKFPLYPIRKKKPQQSQPHCHPTHTTTRLQRQRRQFRMCLN